MAIDDRLSPAALAQMKQDFVDLQEGINTLSFPEDLLRGLDKFNTLLESSGAKLTTMASRIEANKEEMERMTAIMNDATASAAEMTKADERLSAIKKENTQLTADLTDNIDRMKQSLTDQSEQLNKAGAQETHGGPGRSQRGDGSGRSREAQQADR